MKYPVSSTQRFGRSILSIAVALASASISSIRAQISISNASPVTQNFDGIGTTNTASLPANWKMTVAGTATPTWDAAGNVTATNQAASSGTPTTGARYNWGNGTTTTDRAVGFMTSGSYGSPNSVMAHYINNTGGFITDLAISFDIERYRINTAAAAVTFFTSTDGSTWTAQSAGDSGAFSTGSSAYNFTTGTVVSKSFSLTGLSISTGSPIYLRWNFNTTGSSSQGLGLDNVSVAATFSGDTTAPTISTRTPADDATGVIATTNLVAVFSEPVSKGATGDITLKLSADDTTIFTIPVTDAAVSVSGSTATITLPSSLLGTTGYYVNIAAGAFKDTANLDFTGITDNSTWNFTTAVIDTTAPAPVTLSPLDDSNTAFPTQNLVVTFDETIVAGSGSLVIKKFSDDSVVETIAVPSSLVTITGATATINPASILAYGTAYYVEIAAGTFKDNSNNGNLALSGNATWNFTTRAAPQVVISQYYEGSTAADRYIELKNLTPAPLLLTGYRLAAWSDTPPSDNEGWKSGANITDRVTNLDGITIPANGYYLIVEPGPGVPAYAANNFDLATDPVLVGATDFNGDDSLVLYNGTGFTQNEIVDAFPISAMQAENISVYRVSDVLQGFDFNTGTSFLNFTGTWATKTLTEVNTATFANDWYLKASKPPKILTLSTSLSSISEGAGPAAATATVSILGALDEDLSVNIVSSNPTEAQVQTAVVIPQGFTSAPFPINAINDAFLDGSKTVSITVSSPGYSPASQNITVTDELTDVPFPVVINEVDADQAGTDSNEFIELYNNSSETVSLDGVVLVLYNGGATNDASYDTIDLTGKTIAANGYFVIGSATVPNVGQVEFTTDGIQNGADAVALYLGNVADFPNGTPANTTNGVRVDAVVYDTNDADDSGLLASLTSGNPQIDEGAPPASETRSISRVPDGGAAYATALFVAQTPTPGATNILPPSVTTPTSADITASSATLGGDVISDGGSAIMERGIVYSVTTTNADPLIDGSGVTKVTASGTTGVFTANSTGLLANTGYSFKAYAINSRGTTYTSPVSVFTTLTAATAYDVWNDTIGDQAPGLDFDGDGLGNGVEYFMGTAGNAFTPNPGIVAGTVTWPRASGTVITSWSVQVSTDLVNWENATVNYSANLNTSNPNQVVFTMPTTPGKFFVKLQVTP